MFPFTFEWLWDPSHLVFMGALFVVVHILGIGMAYCVLKALNDTFHFLEQGEDYFTHVEGVGAIPRDIYKYVKSDPVGDLPRYSGHIVAQHILLFVTFLVLAATGLPLHFSDLGWSRHLISAFGGADLARLVHRIAAFAMAFTAVYHVATIVIGTAKKIAAGKFDILATQIPLPKDLFDLVNDIRYFMGFRSQRPKMAKFMYKQKLHYLAILWGMTVMLSAGATLLWPEIMVSVWPSPEFAHDLSRLMHADEAIMAILVIVFWHWSNVHLAPGRFPFQWAFLTGRVTREHQIEEHFLEYLKNLREIPEEREYMRNLLQKLEAGELVSDQTVGEDLLRTAKEVN